MTSRKLPECKSQQADLFADASAPHVVEWRKQRISTGYHITAWCRQCARPVSGGLFPSKALFTDEEREAMPWIDGAEDVQICPICNTARRLEEHHLAPRSLFPDEFHLWPTVDVCRECHERWHARMGQPIRKPGAAA